MIDSKKVMKGLECHADGHVECQANCPYANESGCQLLLCRDALSLLKEQQETIELQGSLLTLAHAAMTHGKKEGTRDIARPGRN